MNHIHILVSAALLTILIPGTSAGNRKIVRTEHVRIRTAEGTVPALPFQISVRYSDGSKGWRQVRWDNYERKAEERLAEVSEHPAGSRYEVDGLILGTDRSVKASVKVVRNAQPVPGAKPVAETLPLCDVSLTGNNRLTSNRDLDIERLLSLDITQQLYNYRDTYGLSTEGYTRSDGWDSPTTKLKGHGSGHYMSALAFAYASCADPARKDSLKARIRTMVDALRECQERTFVWNDSLGRWWEARDLAQEEELRSLQGSWEDFDGYKQHWEKYGYGYLNAIPAQHPVLVEMYRPYNNDKWVWAPYYSIHKQLAGLIDIAGNVDDEAIAGKALLIAEDMGLWVWNRLHYRTFIDSEGTEEQRRSRPGNRYEMWNMYIAGEVGGMEEALSRLAAMSDDPGRKAQLEEAASYFDAPAFFTPVSKNIDDIRNRHANQHIPMITGALRAFRNNGNPFYYRLALNFWNLVRGRYAYATGGVGNGEMFREPYSQMHSLNTNASTGWHGEKRADPDINETCCSYNLAKLTRDLNCYDPDDARYMDYYERLLYNQIVGSVHPEHYSVTYQYAVGLDARKPFGNTTPQSTCCGGTGAENHVKYQEAAYFVSDRCLWVALYLPTDAVWKAKGVTIAQECVWPAEKSSIRIQKGSARFAMKLRVPYWAERGFEVRVNGRLVATDCKPCSYVRIPSRKWKEGDCVEVSMPFGAHIDFAPDKMDVAVVDGAEKAFEPRWAGALMYGPLVMASEDIHSWEDAEFTVEQDLSDIKLLGAGAAGGRNGSLYSLEFHGRIFKPDYWQTGRSTHYLRLDVAGND